jgi:hypothetical protein
VLNNQKTKVKNTQPSKSHFDNVKEFLCCANGWRYLNKKRTFIQLSGRKVKMAIMALRIKYFPFYGIYGYDSSKNTDLL